MARLRIPFREQLTDAVARVPGAQVRLMELYLNNTLTGVWYPPARLVRISVFLRCNIGNMGGGGYRFVLTKVQYGSATLPVVTAADLKAAEAYIVGSGSFSHEDNAYPCFVSATDCDVSTDSGDVLHFIVVNDSDANIPVGARWIVRGEVQLET